MFPNLQMKQTQRGAMLPIVIFIIVVVGLLGTIMVRMSVNLGQATVADVYGARAYLAARSGAEVFLTELFPLDAETNAWLCQPRTEPRPIEPPQMEMARFNTEGLNSCHSEILCDHFTLPDPFAGNHFRVIAKGICTAGDAQYSKQIIFEASDGAL